MLKPFSIFDAKEIKIVENTAIETPDGIPYKKAGIRANNALYSTLCPLGENIELNPIGFSFLNKMKYLKK